MKPAPKPAVEGLHASEQAAEVGFAGVGQLDDLGATVLRVTLAGDEPGRLHAGEVMGERCALDADVGSELALHPMARSLERGEHEPGREAAPGLTQLVVEGSAERARSAGDEEPDRLGTGRP